MIHHFSLPAKNPRRVADVLSQLWQGEVYPFPSSTNSFVVFKNDNDQGLCLEIYPLGTQLSPGKGEEQVQVNINNSSSQFCEFHAAISVPLCWEQIEAIAQQEGWRAVVSNRGGGCYQIVEFWIENRFLLELLTPQMLTQYSAFMTPQNWEKFFDLELLFNKNSQSFAYRSRRQQFKVM